MKAYFKGKSQIKRDEIAARQRSAPANIRDRDKKMPISDIVKMFNELKDQA